jgi:hypothetical protein
VTIGSSPHDGHDCGRRDGPLNREEDSFLQRRSDRELTGILTAAAPPFEAKLIP